MAKNYGEDLYGNESDACSFCGAKRCDGPILLSYSKGCNICSKCIDDIIDSVGYTVCGIYNSSAE